MPEEQLSTSVAGLEEQLDALYSVKEELRKAGQDIATLKLTAKEMEDALILRMDDLGLAKIGTDDCNFSIREDFVPTVDPDDWDEVRSWAIKNGYSQLLPRKLNTAPYKELIEMGIEVPWVTKHVVIKTSLTRAKR